MGRNAIRKSRLKDRNQRGDRRFSIVHDVQERDTSIGICTIISNGIVDRVRLIMKSFDFEKLMIRRGEIRVRNINDPIISVVLGDKTE